MSNPARLILVLGCAAALSGCVSLLPKGKPAHLYRFGQSSAAAPAPLAAKQVGVLRGNGAFQQESAGDRILTVTGERAAYIAETRWVAPAQVLFDQATARAFETSAGPARLVARGEPSTAEFALRVDVRNFETRYDDGPETTPSVLIRVRAVLSRNTDRQSAEEKVFEVRAPAASNRVSSIVGAYDKATTDVLKQLVDWTNASATRAPASAPTPARSAASPR